MDIFPTFKPGKYGQASTSVPSAEKLSPIGRIGKKRVLVNTPICEEEICNSTNISSCSD
jgi:hypothetical protein